jgi:hypothetical protein
MYFILQGMARRGTCFTANGLDSTKQYNHIIHAQNGSLGRLSAFFSYKSMHI